MYLEMNYIWSIEHEIISSFIILNTYLVGGFNPSEKYQSIGMIIILENIKNMFQTTNQ